MLAGRDRIRTYASRPQRLRSQAGDACIPQRESLEGRLNPNARPPATPLPGNRETEALWLPRIPWKSPSQTCQSGNQPAPPIPLLGARRSFAGAHREPGRERKMSFPAARWRCQLIGRGRGPRAGLGASLAAAGAQLSGKNWGGCYGEISYRSLGGAAGPRSALTAADPGRARRAGCGEEGAAVGAGPPLPPPLCRPPHPGCPPPPSSSSPRPPCRSALSSPLYPAAVSTHGRPRADRRPRPAPARPPPSALAAPLVGLAPGAPRGAGVRRTPPVWTLPPGQRRRGGKTNPCSL